MLLPNSDDKFWKVTMLVIQLGKDIKDGVYLCIIFIHISKVAQG